ncbi:leukemia inhibitory factor receptor-like isoform X1 [Acipenser ruthenus]|uniref:leukemia inhibitory factor receptor-like isoform X1 n=1 Tax=Acipenser ruthenus TaxID=7906 RepID=UPI001561A0CE|nr:leukemia inhibitory factor receptor-like isoform X1 [Acipenser ruthenus]XP_033890253.2 leukemia inhibitory factor receptor-like isoform X1 [Acipenser ruthenus]XP_033890255.2 leukemia inhibitory factor receptor-like isoform X1 [Acipenser ruthenus]
MSLFLLLTFLLLELDNGGCNNEVTPTFTPHIIAIMKMLVDNEEHLIVNWSVSDVVYKAEVNITFQIQVSRTEDTNIIHTSNYTTVLTKNNTVLTWNWESEIPLECTSHFIRIRSNLNDTRWSDWSPWKANSGIDTSNATKAILFPKGKKIARNGSAVYFCCVAGKDERVTRMSVHNKNYFLIQISQRTQAIKVEYDLPVSYGNDIDCIATKTKADPSILFFINPPDVPNNLTCETRDMKEVVCTWRTWQEAMNSNPDTETIYSLHEGLLQKVGKCQKESCSFKVTPGQNVYNITVKAKNKVGKAAAHLNMDITHRVYPVDLSEVSKNGVGPRTVNLSWFLKANYSSLGIVCQTNITTDNGNQKLQNHSFEGGLDNHSYTVTVDGLHPYTNYAVSIHCASEHFWKWNGWSKAFSFITEQDAPSVGPDVWRQIKQSPQGRNVTLYWKYSNNSETNGPVLFYNITRTSQGRSTQVVPVVGVNWKEFSIDHNAHTITVRAVNSAGGSPTSILNIPADIGMAEENIEAKQINGNAEGFIITWQQDLEVTCGYTVEWCDQVGAKTCDLQWKKFPSHTNSAFITSATFTAGKRYTFNVYVCKSDGDNLFEKKVGYTQELAPSEMPRVTTQENSFSVTLEWTFDDHEMLPGFIKGYYVYITKKNKEAAHSTEPNYFEFMIDNPSKKKLTVPNLQPSTDYNITVAAFTAAGRGRETFLTVRTHSDSAGLLFKLGMVFLVPVLVALIVIMCAWQYRRKLKKLGLLICSSSTSENIRALQWDSSIFETSKTVQSTEPEDCTYCKIEIVESKKEKEELLPTPSSEFESENEEFTVSHTAWTYCLNKPPAPGEKENTDFKDLKGSVEFANLSYFPDQNLLGSQESDPQHASIPTNLSPIKMAIATLDYVSHTS